MDFFGQHGESFGQTCDLSDPKAQMLSLQSFLREGRVVGPSWEKLKPKGPKGVKSLDARILCGGLFSDDSEGP